jgi:chromate transporter
VALCQFLPGPASSQVGIAIGLSQAGLRGALAAWVGFTLPSAVAIAFFAMGISTLSETVVHSGWLHGLKVAAVAVVAQAGWWMAKTLCPDRPRGSLALVAATIALAWPSVWGQVTAILAGGLFGWWTLRGGEGGDHEPHLVVVGKGTAVVSLSLFFLLLLGLPLLAAATESQLLTIFDRFFRVGSLVFGGGHVVLPLLQAEVVNPGWLSRDLLLAAFYNPVWTSGILSAADFTLGLLAFGLLALGNVAPGVVVGLGGGGGAGLALL